MSAPAARPVHVVTDSTADIPEPLLAGRPITVVPLLVEVGGRTYRDGVDLSRDEFLAALRRGELPRTSQPPIGAFQEVYRDLIERGYDVAAAHIASRLSGTFNASRNAAAAVAPERIRVVDSQTLSIALGWLALEAADLAARGAGLEEVAAFMERRKADARIFAALETLEFLLRGGRIGRTAAFLGSALQIKPVVAVRSGAVEPLERVRTFRRATERVIALTQAEMPYDRLAVFHLGAPELASEIARRLEEAQPGIEILTGQIGTVIGTYAGPGLIGTAGLVSPRA
ncbi:MAG: DegV family protein [Thermomicrobiaceae bacterium]|nr:DegV family protein [Thermomicrobiaceae bacterium]